MYTLLVDSARGNILPLKSTENFCTSSVSPDFLHGFARSLAPVAFLRNVTLLSINMKVICRAGLVKKCEQAIQCNNSGETEEVININDFFS